MKINIKKDHLVNKKGENKINILTGKPFTEQDCYYGDKHSDGTRDRMIAKITIDNNKQTSLVLFSKFINNLLYLNDLLPSLTDGSLIKQSKEEIEILKHNISVFQKEFMSKKISYDYPKAYLDYCEKSQDIVINSSVEKSIQFSEQEIKNVLTFLYIEKTEAEFIEILQKYILDGFELAIYDTTKYKLTSIKSKTKAS